MLVSQDWYKAAFLDAETPILGRWTFELLETEQHLGTAWVAISHQPIGLQPRPD